MRILIKRKKARNEEKKKERGKEVERKSLCKGRAEKGV